MIKKDIKSLLKRFDCTSISIVEKLDIAKVGIFRVSCCDNTYFNSKVEEEVLLIEDTITKENIDLYYEFMSDEDLEIYSEIIHPLLHNRAYNTLRNLYTIDPFGDNSNREFENFDDIVLTISTDGARIQSILFGIKDTLKPIDEYIADIKSSDKYEECIFKKKDKYESNK